MQGHEGSWIKGNALWIRLASIVNIHFGHFCNLQREDFPIDKSMNIKKNKQELQTLQFKYSTLSVFVQSLSTHIADIIMTIPKPSWKLKNEKAMYLTYWQYIFSIDWIPWIYFKALTPKCTSWRQIINTTNLESIQIWLWEPMELTWRWRELKKHNIFWSFLAPPASHQSPKKLASKQSLCQPWPIFMMRNGIHMTQCMQSSVASSLSISPECRPQARHLHLRRANEEFRPRLSIIRHSLSRLH